MYSIRQWVYKQDKSRTFPRSGVPFAFKYWWGSVHQLGKGEKKKGERRKREKKKRGKGEKKNRGKEEKEKKRKGEKKNRKKGESRKGEKKKRRKRRIGEEGKRKRVKRETCLVGLQPPEPLPKWCPCGWQHSQALKALASRYRIWLIKKRCFLVDIINIIIITTTTIIYY